MMKTFIPYEKLSKKEKRKADLAKRQTWGELNPVTRKPANSKAYSRNKTRNWQRDAYHETNSGSYYMPYTATPTAAEIMISKMGDSFFSDHF